MKAGAQFGMYLIVTVVNSSLIKKKKGRGGSGREQVRWIRARYPLDPLQDVPKKERQQKIYVFYFFGNFLNICSLFFLLFLNCSSSIFPSFHVSLLKQKRKKIIHVVRVFSCFSFSTFNCLAVNNFLVRSIFVGESESTRETNSCTFPF